MRYKCVSAAMRSRWSRYNSLVEIPGIAIRLAEWRNMVLRCFQDGFLTHVYKYLGFLVTDPVDMLRRNHDLLVGIPMAGLHNQMTNRPLLSSMIKSMTWLIAPSLVWMG